MGFKAADGLDAQSLAESILEIMARPTYGLDYGRISLAGATMAHLL